MKHTLISLAILVLISACTPPAQEADLRQGESDFVQERNGLLHGEVMALAYSGFREGQHPDRGIGARNPTDEQILEDLHILVDHGYGLIRLYDTGENSRTTLELIEKHDLPIKVLLGIWLRAEVSNHEGCPWLDEPIPADELAANRLENGAEIKRGIELARRFEEIVVAISVGNEALVDWNTRRCRICQSLFSKPGGLRLPSSFPIRPMRQTSCAITMSLRHGRSRRM